MRLKFLTSKVGDYQKICLLGDGAQSLPALNTNTMLDTKVHRHAAYYAPAQHSRLGQLGAQWLGRCAQSRCAVLQPDFPHCTAEALHGYTAAATRYGWHATLKAPFALQSGLEIAAVTAAFKAFAQTHTALSLPPLTLRNMGDYLALVPATTSSALQELAFGCVRALHPLAKPLSDTQIAQRRLTPLTPGQDAMLLQWGYPFVDDQFQWHMTLTGSLQGLPEGEVRALQEAALDWFDPVFKQPVELDAICWFVEPVAGGDFYEAQRFALGCA
jgi:hypothetical protein